MTRKKKQKAYLDKYNTEIQYYRGIPFKLITVSYRAMRFLLNPEKENKFKYAGLEIPDWMRGKL